MSNSNLKTFVVLCLKPFLFFCFAADLRNQFKTLCQVTTKINRSLNKNARIFLETLKYFKIQRGSVDLGLRCHWVFRSFNDWTDYFDLNTGLVRYLDPHWTFLALRMVRKNIKFKHLLVAKYSGDLNIELVWYLHGQKVVGCQFVCFLNAI